MAKKQFLTTNRIKEILAKVPADQRKSVLEGIVARGHEVEGFNAEFSPLETVKNVPESLKEFGKSIWTSVSNPNQTIESVSDIYFGGLFQLIPDSIIEPEKLEKVKDQRQKFDAIIDFFKERYGSKEKVLETFERDPVGVLSDISVFFTGGGTAAAKGGLLASKLPVTAKTAAIIAKVSGKTGEALRAIGEITDVVKLTGKISWKTINKTKRINKALGIDKFFSEKVAQIGTPGLKLTPTQARNISKNTFGVPPGEVIASWGITGDLPQVKAQLIQRAKITYDLVNQELAKIPGNFRNQNTQNILAELSNKFRKLPDDESRKIVKRSQELFKKHSKNGLTLTEFNEVKRMANGLLDIFNKSGGVKSGLKAKSLNNMRSSVQKFIEKKADEFGAPDIKMLNRETKFAQDLQRMIDGNMLASYAKSSSLLNKFFIGGGLAGGIAYWNPSILFVGLGLSGANKLIQSTKFRTKLAQAIAKRTFAEQKALFTAIETGKNTPQSVNAFRKAMQDLKSVAPELNFPAINMAGVISLNDLKDRELKK